MLKIIGIVSACLLLSACSYLSNSETSTQKARCKEIKYRMITNPATNDPMVAAQKSAESDNLNRSYRDDDCN